MLGEAYLKQWKIPQGQPMTLKFGALRQSRQGRARRKVRRHADRPKLSQKNGAICEAPTLRIQYRSESPVLARAL